jgi:hypothetical protein
MMSSMTSKFSNCPSNNDTPSIKSQSVPITARSVLMNTANYSIDGLSNSLKINISGREALIKAEKWLPSTIIISATSPRL